MKFPAHLQRLIEVLKQLPGVGAKSAERFAFHLLTRSEGQLQDMALTIAQIKERIYFCTSCGCLADHATCDYCHSPARKKNQLCIIASPRDAFAIERTNEYQGLYHVLGGLLSPIDGRGPETLQLDKLLQRIEQLAVSEVVIALDATLEGDATALYLKQELAPYSVEISRLAFGMPMGSSLDYVDGDTLGRALSGRRHF